MDEVSENGGAPRTVVSPNGDPHALGAQDAETVASSPDYERQISILFSFLSNLYGPDKLVLKAGKLDALKLMRSKDPGDRLLALQRLVFEDPTLSDLPDSESYAEILNVLEEEIADVVAMRTVEESLDRKIAHKMQERHLDYLRELRREALKEEDGPENSTTLKRLAELEVLEERRLDASALAVMRPSRLAEVVGQESAIQSLMTKLGTPYPQHVLLYGPPGVGKTTVARLVLEEVKSYASTPFANEAPFVEVDATTVRWDPREITNPLLGSVHDPIYQGSRRDLAEEGIPEPKLGLVTRAHGGVLFIDEIGELDPILQNKLLKVLEDKRIVFESSYFDEDDPRVPQYIRRLFTQGAPADFILIGATTRAPEDITPAIRSRCAEVFFEPLSPAQIREIVKNAASRLNVTLRPDVAELISQYTTEGRKAVCVLADAYGHSFLRKDTPRRKRIVVTREDVFSVIRADRLTRAIPVRAGTGTEVGCVFGLGVLGFVGSCLEIEAAAYPARQPGKGTLRFNEAAGQMAKDSVFNSASVIRRLLDKDLSDYDVHVNVIGGGRIDGPSAGLAVVVALVSALEGLPVPQDLAMTGEVSIQAKVKPVGGVAEKLHGAVQAGMRAVLIPSENMEEVRSKVEGLQVVPVRSVVQAFEFVWPQRVWAEPVGARQEGAP
ncbi:MAG: ATP-dependent protease, Lon family [Armatimonadetes bacterium]|nr:ATP-dependent protease, Lon family [Armatimonadota bacterium]